ncbi:hypothetical protein [Cohnella terricola]|uniref:DUF4386 family protein n=1 Tax=Cohnella terricola TaxID=1289167 RepID=A0A559JTV7_9BACL|nr:hypothetical protein [Cohnella terricola]TVY03311.1 hypothetical protein FPZ45_05410 [Cohnella terricola]
MSNASLYRFGGVFLILGPLLGVIAAIVGLFTETSFQAPVSTFHSALWPTYYSLSLLGGMLLLIGLPALYVRQSGGRGGKIGLVGILLYALSICMGLAVSGYLISILPYLADKSPNIIEDSFKTSIATFPLGSFLFGLIGAVLLCIAVIRAKVYPSYVGILLLLSGVLDLSNIFATDTVASIIGLISQGSLLLAFSTAGIKLFNQRKPLNSEAHQRTVNLP